MPYRSEKDKVTNRKKHNPERAAQTREERRQQREASIVRQNRQYTRTDLAWAAGLFEGEGCFSTVKNTRANTASLTSTDKDVVERFQRIVGFGSAHEKPPEKVHHKTQWVWKVASFEYFQATVALFWPWLCERRRQRALDILNRRLKYFAGSSGRGLPRKDSNKPRPYRQRVAA